ncbi:MAG: glyoxalase superfamily protein [Pseudomonadota bacterium]
MDTQQLKQLAGRLRAFLEDAAVEIGHGQALDLSASLVGLRNWPEVQAFPQRVQAQELDLSATARLAYRLAHKYKHEASSTELLQLLLPPADAHNASTLQIWPAGPEAGVYVTTSQAAIDALVEMYQEATDGAVFYAERAGWKHDAAISLGDDGLWSSGLDRVPSGTLIVLGPVELDQQSWREASERVEMACLRAENPGHRVAILFDTPTPEFLGADATMMLLDKGYDDLHECLVGTVAENGTLKPGLVKHYGTPSKAAAVTDAGALPVAVADQLKAVLDKRSRGIIALGSIEDVENHGAKIGEAALALTEHLGLAARIMSRHRSTMSKFDQVPAAVRQLPFLASIESAYAQGYRRFLIDPRYTKTDVLARFVDDSLIIACTYAATVDELATHAADAKGSGPSLLPWLLAAVVVAPVQTQVGTEVLTDVYIGVDDAYVEKGDYIFDFVARHRTIRIEDQFRVLVDRGEIDLAAASEAGIGQRTIKRLLQLLDAER